MLAAPSYRGRAVLESPAGRHAAPPVPASERLLVGSASFFALFSVCCHAMVALGGSLRALLALFAVSLLGVGLGRNGVRAIEALQPQGEHGCGGDEEQADGNERLAQREAALCRASHRTARHRPHLAFRVRRVDSRASPGAFRTSCAPAG